MPGNTIVVGYDGSAAATRATRWALDEAVRVGAPVELCWAGSTMAPGARRRIEDMLIDACIDAAATHPAVDVRTVVGADPAAELIRRRSAAAALVVLGSRGGCRPGGPIGAVSAAVSRHAGCPVMVIRSRADGIAPVLAGIDGSDAAGLVLEFAFDQAATRHVPLRVVRAVLPAGRASGLEATMAAERRALADLVERTRAAYPEVEATHEVIVGHPAMVLLDAAAAAQLVVVGTRAERAFRGTQLGSVSRHLLRHAETSVAVIRDAPARLAPALH